MLAKPDTTTPLVSFPLRNVPSPPLSPSLLPTPLRKQVRVSFFKNRPTDFRPWTSGREARFLVSRPKKVSLSLGISRETSFSPRGVQEVVALLFVSVSRAAPRPARSGARKDRFERRKVREVFRSAIVFRRNGAKRREDEKTYDGGLPFSQGKEEGPRRTRQRPPKKNACRL